MPPPFRGARRRFETGRAATELPRSPFPRTRIVPFRHTLLCALAILAAPPAMSQVRQTPTPTPPAPTVKAPAKLQLVARFADQQITGVAIGEDGRIFVNLPRWTVDVPVSVGTLKDGAIVPYPDAAWNAWRNDNHLSPQTHFVCVQSVVADGHGALWVLDPAAPGFSGPVKNGPKLVEIDLKTNKVVKTIPFGDAIAPPGSYLNDIRFSPDAHFGYITDSGVKGAIVVVDLTTGQARRVLDGDISTQFDPHVIVQVDGHALRRPDGRSLNAGADGIAVSADGSYVYHQALDGDTLYRIAAAALQDPKLTAQQLSAKVERVQKTHPADGLWIDSRGWLYITDPAHDAIESGQPGQTMTVLAQDKRLRWPDSFAQGPGGTLYVTASHIQDSPWFKPGAGATPSAVFRVVQ
jgi:sugar lactone lactonase YvrE